MYNLTFYESQTHIGHCHWWTEADTNRAANDVATPVVKFLILLDLSAKYEEVNLSSDTCHGQNRNKIIITAILAFLTSSANIKNFTEKFFESGHPHMECDAMHNSIVCGFRDREIELPSDYI